MDEAVAAANVLEGNSGGELVAHLRLCTPLQNIVMWSRGFLAEHYEMALGLNTCLNCDKTGINLLQLARS